jgi:C4-dicarboxylate-specific signal transduction histidine kinase
MALRGENRKDFKISRSIRLAIENYRTRLKDNDVKLTLDANDDFEVFARFGAIAQVFSNLLDNSLYWLESSENQSREIRIKIDSDHRSVLFSDNGPDVHSAILPHLFMPGYSMKVPRSGLGLYICKYYMQDMKGDIQNLQSTMYRDPEMEGAQFFLDFNMVRRGNNRV